PRARSAGAAEAPPHRLLAFRRYLSRPGPTPRPLAHGGGHRAGGTKARELRAGSPAKPIAPPARLGVVPSPKRRAPRRSSKAGSEPLMLIPPSSLTARSRQPATRAADHDALVARLEA